MQWILWIPILLAATTLVVCLLARARRGHREVGVVGAAYSARGSLLSAEEQRFEQALALALEGRFRIAAKVRLADVIEPAKSIRGDARRTLQERIDRISLDFVLCDWRSYEVLAGILLTGRGSAVAGGDGSHPIVDEALRSANIHCIRVPMRASYTTALLAVQIESAMARDFVETLTLATMNDEEHALTS